MILILAILAWVIAGTITFRRIGHDAITQNAEYNEWRTENYQKIGSHHEKNCNKGLRFGKSLGHRDCDCELSEESGVWLPFVFIVTYLFWPLFATYWGIKNLSVLYGRKFDKDVKFFIPTKWAKTNGELLTESQSRLNELEIKIKELEAETL